MVRLCSRRESKKERNKLHSKMIGSPECWQAGEGKKYDHASLQVSEKSPWKRWHVYRAERNDGVEHLNAGLKYVQALETRSTESLRWKCDWRAQGPAGSSKRQGEGENKGCGRKAVDVDSPVARATDDWGRRAVGGFQQSNIGSYVQKDGLATAWGISYSWQEVKAEKIIKNLHSSWWKMLSVWVWVIVGDRKKWKVFT